MTTFFHIGVFSLSGNNKAWFHLVIIDHQTLCIYICITTKKWNDLMRYSEVVPKVFSDSSSLWFRALLCTFLANWTIYGVRYLIRLTIGYRCVGKVLGGASPSWQRRFGTASETRVPIRHHWTVSLQKQEITYLPINYVRLHYLTEREVSGKQRLVLASYTPCDGYRMRNMHVLGDGCVISCLNPPN